MEFSFLLKFIQLTTHDALDHANFEALVLSSPKSIRYTLAHCLPDPSFTQTALLSTEDADTSLPSLLLDPMVAVIYPVS